MRLADQFRKTVSGSKDGKPDWVKYIEIGDDEGLFGIDSAVWQVHGCIATLVGGVRALLLQACHPAPLAGVAQHSRYETDPVGRLIGTTRWLTITSFASTEGIAREAARVNEMHSHVTGNFHKADGSESAYRAKDPRFLLWVHCAFTDSFLKAHLMMGYPIDKGGDAYVAEWSKSAIPLGLANAPQTMAELESTLEDFRTTELGRTELTDGVVKFILKPPFGRGALIFYRLIANAAIATMDRRELDILGLKPKSKIWLKLARFVLDIFIKMLGNESPSQKVARERIARINKTNS